MSAAQIRRLEIGLEALSNDLQKTRGRIAGEIPNLNDALQVHRLVLAMVLRVLMAHEDEPDGLIAAVLTRLREMSADAGVDAQATELDAILGLISQTSWPVPSRAPH